MQEKVLIEISKYCENCPLHEKCKDRTKLVRANKVIEKRICKK